jgi:FKBP-type peptidyl-prolyl cis-trans isomerase (trigger factor)
MIWSTSALVCFVVASMTSSVVGGPFDPPEQPQQQPQQIPQQQSPQVQPRVDVVAMVNGDAITRAELQASVQSQLRGQQPDPQTVEKLQKQVLDGLIESRLVEQYVIDKGPDVEKEEVDGVLNQFKQQLQTQGIGFEEFLAARGQTEKSLEKRVEGSLAWQKYQQKHVTENKLQEYFQQNQDRFAEDDFEQAREKVLQAYAGELWSQIVKEMRPEAEIKTATPEQPAAPRGFPQQPQQP